MSNQEWSLEVDEERLKMLVKNGAFSLVVMVWLLSAFCSCKTTNYAFKQLDFIKEAPDGTISHRPIPVATFSYPEDKRVVLFCNLYNYERSYQVEVEWITPENKPYKRQDRTMSQKTTRSDSLRLSGFYEVFELPTDEIKDYPGEWRVEILIDGKPARTKYFTLLSKNANLQQLTAPSGQAPPQKGATPVATSQKFISVAGLAVHNLNPVSTKQFRSNANEQGVVIYALASGKAYDVGLRNGDIIKEVNQQVILNLDDYNQTLSRAKRDEQLVLKVKRGDTTMLVSIKAPWTDSQEKAQSHYDKGNQLFEANKFREAIASYKKAIEYEDSFAPLYYNLAMAQMAVGENKEAARNLKRYLEIRPNAPNAFEVRQMIKSLGG